MGYPAPKLLDFLTLSNIDIWKFQLSSVVLGMLISFRSCFFSPNHIYHLYFQLLLGENKILYTVCYFPNQWFSKIVPLSWNKDFFFILMQFLVCFTQCHVILTLELSNVLVFELYSQLQIKLLSFDCRLYPNEKN